MIAITHANVFDGLNDSYRENVSVVIEGDHVLDEQVIESKDKENHNATYINRQNTVVN